MCARASAPKLHVGHRHPTPHLIVAGDLENEIREGITKMRRDAGGELLGGRDLGISIAERRELEADQPLIGTLHQIRRDGGCEKDACNDAASFAGVEFVVRM